MAARAGSAAGRRVLAALPVLFFCAALPAAPGLVITEIMYHPPGDDPREEYVELLNAGATPCDLSGARLAGAVAYTFPEGLVLGAGEFLVAAADVGRFAAVYGAVPCAVVGPWNGVLGNEGERLELCDAAGALLCAVEYDDGPPWPVEADGGGAALECLNPRLPIDTPRNWAAARPGWRRIVYDGVASSSVLCVYLLGPGSCLIDDVAIETAAGAAVPVPNGDFAGGLAPWTPSGNHGASAWDGGEGFSAAGCLALTAKAAGDGPANGVVCDLGGALEVGGAYRLSFAAKRLEGSSRLVIRLSGGGLRLDADLAALSHGTPGRPNSVACEELPPLVAAVEVAPVLPAGGERAVVRARVEAEGSAEVRLRYMRHALPDLALRDDGADPDAVAGDGVYAVRLPSFPPGTLVWFEVTAAENGRVARPFPGGVGFAAEAVDSELPVLWLFVAPEDWDRLNADIWTEQYAPALLVADGRAYTRAGVRFRGGRPRLFRKKSLRLNFGHERFLGKRHLLLNAAAMDDDYMTEPLAYRFYADAGVEASETRFVRVQRNGEFWGLFIDVEPVDDIYLARRGLDKDGVLYKAAGIASNLSRLDGTGYVYGTQYEKKTRRDEPYDDLIAFIEGLSRAADPGRYLEETLEVESFARYLAVTNLACVWDAIQHNYYLYRPRGGKWRVIPWDLDHAWGEWEWVYYHGDTYPLLMGHKEHRFAGAWYTWNQLWTVFLDTPRFRARYEEVMAALLNGAFAEWTLFPRIEAYRAAIEATVALDEAAWPDAAEPLHAGPMRTMAQELPLLMANVSRRREYMAGVLGVALRDRPGPRFVRGDANADGRCDVGDAVAVLSHLFAGGPADCRAAADANGDGKLDVADAVRLLAYLFAGAAPPPPPFGDCGEDTAPDGLDCERFPPCMPAP